MRSLGRTVVRIANKSAVPYVAARQSFAQAFAAPAPMVREMEAFGSVGTLFAIVTKLSKGQSAVEWKLWRKDKSGKKEDRTEVTVHLALKIWDKPNDFFTRQEFVETVGQHKELTGEQWWVIARDDRSKLPLELWPVRPDKMRPVPDAEEFIKGYIYTGPSGEQIPLYNNQVIMVRDPNPMDMYRGMGPVQTILPDLTASNMAAQYVANFFANSAEPGGIIEVDRNLSDDEFDQMAARWREQHQGVSNAHRVAILEKSKWIDRKYTMKDMQFTELRSASSEMIREAFGFPKPLLGSVDDVNRANAEAAEYVFAQWLLVPRLEQIKQALNNDFLKLFYGDGVVPDVEFDYESPVPENKEFESADRKSKAEVAAILIGLGADPGEVFEMLDMPALTITKPEPPPVIVAPTEDDPEDEPPRTATNRARRHHPWPTAAGVLPDDEHPDLSGVQESFERELAALILAYTAITMAQKTALIEQLRDIVSSGSVQDLLMLQAASDDGAAALLQAMTSIGADAAEHVVEEADAQGVTINPVPPTSFSLTGTALTLAGLLASGLVFSTIREAQRVWNPSSTADDVAKLVKEQLDALAPPKAILGSALTQAQRSGRMNTLLAAPTAAWYASEQLDKATCEPCRRVNGKWLGNGIIDNVNRMYPTGGYVDCLGRDRCRGMVIGVWRPEKVGDR